MKTTEQRVADAVLQRRMEVTIGGREFQVARPTIATLYDVSGVVSQLDDLEVEMTDNMQDVLTDTLRAAKYAPVHAETLAKLILGAKENGYTEEIRTSKKVIEASLWGLRRTEKTIETVEQIDRFEELKSWLLYNASPQECQAAIVQILGSNSEAAFFLHTTIFLKGTKITKPTKATARGH